MCGFVGLFSNIDEFKGREIVQRSLINLEHRGPDGDGLKGYKVHNNNLIFGHKRLSILDLTDLANQPMETLDEDYSIIFNGEIYNYLELKEILVKSGCLFKTNSDTEVLLNCWAKWGENALDMINGMFSFVILDKQKCTITFARDGYGIKPLYYLIDSNGIYFASEIKSILDILPYRPKKNINRSINYLLTGIHDNTNETFYENIYSLEPGSFFQYSLKSKRRSAIKRWWNPSTEINSKISNEETEERLRSIFFRNLKQHLRSDVEYGITLSGGIDSSILAYSIRKLEPDIPIHTFTYVAKDELFNEKRFSSLVNNDIKGISHEVYIDGSDFINDMEDMVRIQGEPFGDTSIYSQYCVYKAFKQFGIKVSIDGQGADEIFGGYYGYPEQKLKSLIYNKKYIDVIKFIKYLIQSKNFIFSKKFIIFMKSILPNEYLNYVNQLFLSYKIKSNPIFNKKEINFLSESDFYLKRLTTKRETRYGDRYFNNYLKEQQGIEGLAPLVRVLDRNSMNFSVESRVPFLSKELSSFALSLPENKLVSSNGMTKKILRDSFRGYIPDQILLRKDKIGFQTPEYKFINSIKNKIPDLLESCYEIPFMNYSKTVHFFKNLIQNEKNYDPIAWRILNYCLWWRIDS